MLAMELLRVACTSMNVRVFKNKFVRATTLRVVWFVLLAFVRFVDASKDERTGAPQGSLGRCDTAARG